MPACRHTIAGPSGAVVEGGGERVRAQPPLVVGRHHLGGAEAEVAQGHGDGLVVLGAGQDPQPRGAHQAALGHAPAGPPQHLVAGGGQAGEVGHRAAGDEADRGVGGQAEQVQQPGRGDLLDGGARRGEPAQQRVLVPGGDEPVRRQRRGQRPADDEPEEPPRRHRRQPGVDGGGEVVDDVGRRRRLGGQLGAQRRDDVVDVRARRHRPVGQRAEPLPGVTVGVLERGVVVRGGPGHGPVWAAACGVRTRSGDVEGRSTPHAGGEEVTLVAQDRDSPGRSGGGAHRPSAEGPRYRADQAR